MNAAQNKGEHLPQAQLLADGQSVLSFGLDLRLIDYLGELLGFRGDKLLVFGGRHRARDDALASLEIRPSSPPAACCSRCRSTVVTIGTDVLV